MIIRHAKKTAPFAIALILAITVAVFLFLAYQSKGNAAADVSKFDPGNLMTDATMSNKNSMNVQQIQAFLNSKNACNNTNIHLAQRYPHLQYNIRNGRFVCMAQDSFNGQSAAQIIWEVAQQYSINPQVLIILLEKEQGLVSDTWPNHIQYRTATGYGCPDNLPQGAPPCEAQYFGLKNQLRHAASLFRTVLNGGWSNYPVGNTFVQYNPNAACGGSVINIKNRATSALYRYTPYQPNRSALNAGYGTGDSCSAYGNRNAWMLHQDWFGGDSNPFSSLDDPRWLEIKRNTQKVSLGTGAKFGPILRPGQQIFFPDKFHQNNQWHVRTQFGNTTNSLDGIPLNDVGAIPIESFPVRLMSTKNKTQKIDPLRNRTYEPVAELALTKVTSSIRVNGVLYYRTQWEDDQNRTRFIKASDLENLKMYDFINPRTLHVKEDAQKIDIRTGNVIGTIPKGSMVEFNKRVTIGSTLYAQPVSDNGTFYAVSMNNLSELHRLEFEELISPRVMKLDRNTFKQRFPENIIFGPELSLGTEIFFPDKIFIEGRWYLRSQWDQDQGRFDAIPIERITER